MTCVVIILKSVFFEELNPTWMDGTELPCIGEIAWKGLARYPMRFFTKPISKGQTEASLELCCTNLSLKADSTL